MKERRISQSKRKLSRNSAAAAAGNTGEPKPVLKGKEGGFIPPKHVLQFVVR